MKKIYFAVIALFALLSCVACEQMALMTTPAKKPMASHTQLAEQAESVFWQTLHQGDYDHIPHALYLLTAAYLDNPFDAKLAAHLGFLHIWQLAEAGRESTSDPRIVEHAILAKKYFSDAVLLAPQDARFLGFYGDALLIQGKIFQDKKQQVKAYYVLKRAIRAWPQFNYFTAGYPMSILSANDPSFQEGLDWQWRTLDVCAGEPVNRNNPDFSPYMPRATLTGLARACWNSWIAPFNFEGFFLNMGDMLVKAGQPQVAVKIYNNAKLASNYSQWKYRSVLEARIRQATENVSKFNEAVILTQPATEPAMMFRSKFACMACHER